MLFLKTVCKGCAPVSLFDTGGSFERWSLVEGTEVTGSCPQRELWDNSCFHCSFCSLLTKQRIFLCHVFLPCSKVLP